MAKIPVVLAIHARNDRLSSYDDVSILVLHGIKLYVAVGTWLKPMRTVRPGELISLCFTSLETHTKLNLGVAIDLSTSMK